jgi:hypothetical protein
MQTAIGNLLYVQIGTRLDILFAVSHLAQVVTLPQTARSPRPPSLPFGIKSLACLVPISQCLVSLVIKSVLPPACAGPCQSGLEALIRMRKGAGNLTLNQAVLVYIANRTSCFRGG